MGFPSRMGQQLWASPRAAVLTLTGWRGAYYRKTIVRLSKVQNLIPFWERRRLPSMEKGAGTFTITSVSWK